jgi:uncharacterized membrane protein
MSHDALATKLAELKLEERLKSGSSWFFWIAALSLLNSAITLSGGQWSFLIGLGLTQVVDVTFATVPAIGLDLLIAGAFVAFGVFARRRQEWPFMVGLIVYTLDALILLTFKDWPGIALHAFALFGIYGGYKAYQQLVAQSAAAHPMPSDSPFEG